MQMKQLLWIAAIVAIAACKKGEDGAAAKVEGPACEPSIKKAVSKLPAAGAGGVQEKLQGVLIQRCTEDKWPAAVIDCYGNATDMKSMMACRQQLPPELKEKASAAIRQVMMLGGGGGGTMVHRPEDVKVPVSDTAGAGSGSAPAPAPQ